MKKILTALVISLSLSALAQPFYEALEFCSPYSQDGGAVHEGQYFNILITLEKSKNKCVYKEKIYQNDKFQMLTCNFDKSTLPWLSESMKRFNEAYKKEISKNTIFEAKMTLNGEIFENYLIKPEYCSISHSSKK